MAVETLTFGCRLNAYEGEVMKAEAEKAGLTDAIIINTCAVTQEAVAQARKAVRKARRDNPHRRIIVTGCAAQTEARSFGDMAEVDLVIGNADKLKAESYRPMTFGLPLNDKVQVNDIMSVRETAGHLIEGMDGHTRAFVQVQNGCDHRCTFCIIPFGRGPSRSVPMGLVVEQIKTLVGNGYREVVLTGVDITSYGPDLPGAPTLGTLVQSILKHVPDLPRLRISSIDSIEADPTLYEAVADPRLMPHLHLSLQSGDDLILKRMKRRHSRDDALGVVTKLRAIRPNMVFGADIIAGFPTETDAMFENTLRFIGEAGITYIHAFTYSPRPGTPAARMPQVDKAMARERTRLLRALAEQQFAALCDTRLGRIENVLMERGGVGRTEQFVPVRVAGVEAGHLVPVEITGREPQGLLGETVRVAAQGQRTKELGMTDKVSGFFKRLFGTEPAPESPAPPETRPETPAPVPEPPAPTPEPEPPAPRPAETPLPPGPPETTPDYVEERSFTPPAALESVPIIPAPATAAPRETWFSRLTTGLKRSSDNLTNSITSVFTKRKLDAATLDELEDVLIQADLGLETAMAITETLRRDRFDREVSDSDVRNVLAGEVEKVLGPVARQLTVDTSKKPFIILMIGVNGSGKTTTIGKLAQKFAGEGKSVMLAAGDTFRAAAIEQLQVWGQRTGAPVIAKPAGSDASGLAFDAVTQAKAEGRDVLIIDTAGRLQNRDELMNELEKVIRVIKKVEPSAPHATLLTLDATTGQNALKQVEIFGQRAGVTGLVMTKLDGTARGGILVAIARKFGLPVHFIGVGEGVDDLEPFEARDFARAIAGQD